MISKVFEKIVNNRIFDHVEKCSLFLISSMISGLLDQMQIFLEFYLIELLGLLTGVRLLESLDLIYPRLSTWFCMLVTLFLLSFLQVVLDGNTQLKLDFLKGFHSPTYFLLFINDLLDDLICNIAIYAADTTLLLM